MSGTSDNVTAIGGDEDLFCPGCGYSLRGATGQRCPECGYSLAYLRIPTSAIPWEHRRQRGRLRTYWQTVWLVTFRTQRFCEEYAHEVRYRDARRFQWMTLLYVYGPLLAVTVYLYVAHPPAHWGAETVRRTPSLTAHAYAEVWPVVGLHGFFFLFLFAATGLPSYFFHPRSVSIHRQNNAVAMSYFAAGTLAWMPVLFFLMWTVYPYVSLDRWLATPVGYRVAAGAVPPVAVAVLLWWWTEVNVMRRIMPQLPRRIRAIAVGLPVLWCVLGAVTLLLLPACLVGLLVVVDSLR